MTIQINMSEIAFSIAIPVYNQATTIESTINSALKATELFPESEIVVSENHSTDSTADLLVQYGDKIRVVKPATHLGMAANWNYAVNACSNKWVGMLSGDDKIYPSYIPALRKAIRRSPSAVFAMGGWKVVDVQSGKTFNRRVLSLPTVSKFNKATAELIFGPKASFASFCFLKSAFDRIGGFSEDYNLVQDWILQFELSLVGDLVKTNSIIAEYTVGQSRAELERRRVPLYCEDFATFCLSTIWKAQRVGIRRARLVNACKIHAARSQDVVSSHPEWHDTVDVLLRPVYQLIGKEMVDLSKSPNPMLSLSRSSRMFIRRCLEHVIPS